MLRSRKAFWMAVRSMDKGLFYTTDAGPGLRPRSAGQKPATTKTRRYTTCDKKYCQCQCTSLAVQSRLNPVRRAEGSVHRSLGKPVAAERRRTIQLWPAHLQPLRCRHHGG